MTDKIFLRNDWDIHRVNMSSRGVLVTGVSPRGFISATSSGATIHASLEVVLTELAPGEYIGTIQGTDLAAQLGPLLDTAELIGQTLTVYERVVVDTMDYDDYLPLRVERARKVKRA